jgi:hypothetical protein
MDRGTRPSIAFFWCSRNEVFLMSGSKSLVFGVSQTGKSTFALYRALTTGKQVVIWDANEVFIDIVKSPVYTPNDLDDALRKGEPVIVYDATGVEDRPEEFEKVAEVLEQYDGHTLLVDEAGDVQRATSPNSGLDRLYRRSGRRGNDIIETTHKATDIATLNRSLTTDVYLFAVSNRKAQKALADEFSEEAAAAAAELPDYVYVHYHPRTMQFEVIDDPDVWYVNLDKQLPEKIERRPSEPSPHRQPLWANRKAEEEFQK